MDIKGAANANKKPGKRKSRGSKRKEDKLQRKEDEKGAVSRETSSSKVTGSGLREEE